MSALTVIILRHGEKAGGDFPGGGVTFEGVPDDKSLVVRGWQRAGAWAALFGSCASPDYPLANKVYAAKPEPIAKKMKFSRRPFETAMPLARRLRLDLDTRFGVGEEEALAATVRSQTGVILIFWEHKAIAASLIPHLVEHELPSGVPLKWDSERFDVALRFDRAVPGAPWSFRQLSPRLLDGDSDMPFAERVA